MERDFLAILGSRGGGTPGPPIEYDDKFAFEAQSAVVQPSILQVLRPSDRLGDFTVVRASDASYTDSSGVIQIAPDNIARIDYSQNVAELLTEPQSTNLIEYSEDFSNIGWATTRASIDLYSAISPDGTMSASKLVEGIENSDHRISHSTITTVSGESYTSKIWVKAAERDEIQIYNNLEGASIFSFVDLNTGVVTGALQLKTTPHQGGYWIEHSGVAATSTVSLIFYIATSIGGSSSYQGDGVSGIYIWGAQLEALPYATSYIPTNGSTVTRLQDQITSGGNSSVINSEEGTMFFEGSALNNINPSGRDIKICLMGANTANTVYIGFDNSDLRIKVDCIVSDVGQNPVSYTLPTLIDNMKFAYKWKVNDFALWYNGAEILTGLSGLSFPTDTLLEVKFNRADNADPFFGRTRELKVYDRALTDEELEQITTIPSTLEIPTNINLTEV